MTASNGIVLSSPYTPLAIMTASPIASVRVFEPVRDADVGSLRSVRSQRRRRYREIIMLNNLLLAPHHHQVRRSHRSIYCWHGHAAAPYRASGFVLWHFSDLPTPLTNVGYQVKSGSNSDIAKSTRLTLSGRQCPITISQNSEPPLSRHPCE